MAGRRIINEHDARRCLAAVRRTGLSLARWAHAHGVDGRSLNLWRLNLERRAGRRPLGSGLVELVPVGMVPTESPAPYRLRVGGVELEVLASFDADSLRRLIAVLKSC